MSPKPPTRIRVTGSLEFPVGKYLVAKLCELGYDIILSETYTFPPFNKFYNVTFEKNLYGFNKVYGFADFTFRVDFWSIKTDDLLLFNKSEVNLDDFVNFFVYCWGMDRGGRLPYDKHMEVTPEKIKEWKLRDLV